MARRIAEVHNLIAKTMRERVYFITLTSHPNWRGIPRVYGPELDEHVNYKRRRAFNLFVDRIRKLRCYRGHYWTTEYHPGKGENAGTIHHHLILRTSGFWNYKQVVVEWSKRYCGSNNGLDIRNPTTGNKAWSYLYGAYKYLDLVDDTEELPFRWWGTSQVARKWKQWADETPVHLPTFTVATMYRARCARVPKHEALSSSARATILHETRRQVRQTKRSRPL